MINEIGTAEQRMLKQKRETNKPKGNTSGLNWCKAGGPKTLRTLGNLSGTPRSWAWIQYQGVCEGVCAGDIISVSRMLKLIDDVSRPLFLSSM
jgi:hypothetical protein